MKKIILILIALSFKTFGQVTTPQPVKIVNTGTNVNTTSSLSATDRAIIDSIKANTASIEAYSGAIYTHLPTCPTCTYVTFTGFYNTDASTLYTVTAGKTFYLTGYDVSMLDFHATQATQITIKDNATAKITYYAGPAGTAFVTYQTIKYTLNMESNPMPFSNSVKMGYTLGSNASGSFFGTFYGYEK